MSTRGSKRWPTPVTVDMRLTFDGQGAVLEPAELARQVASFLGQPDGYGLIFSTQHNGERVGTTWVVKAELGGTGEEPPS